MTNQLITYRLPIDYSLVSLMSLMSSISYVWTCSTEMSFQRGFKKKVISKVFNYKLIIDQVNACRQRIHDFLLVSFDFILGRVLFLCGRYRKLIFIYSENVLFCLRFICDEFYFDTKKTKV